MPSDNRSTAQHFTLEICVDSPASVDAAVEGGAHRLELCSNLAEGGTTPGPGLVSYAKRHSSLDLMMMVRPRGGDFCYTRSEYGVIKEAILYAKNQSLTGVVFGVLTQDGSIDREKTAELLELARPLEVTFHRAFDCTRDPMTALDVLIELGVDRVLTSGQRPTAVEGIGLIRKLVETADGRIDIMPGAGIRPDNVAEILRATGSKSFHGSASERITYPSAVHGEADGVIAQTSSAIVRQMVAAAASIERSA